MGYFKNIDTGDTVLYHGSKDGIKGNISPNANKSKTDFGNGFYMGTKELQTLARVTNEKNPWAYEFRISDQYINKSNCLQLSADEWVYFVLYNRGKLEDMQGTQFYEKYAHLSDDKDFIIGPIADDVYDLCINDFSRNNITDYTFKQLIDCFDYGTQVVAKSERACGIIEKISEKSISKEEKKEIRDRRKLTKNERINYYEKKKAELNIERKGKYLSEIKDEIRLRESKELRETSDMLINQAGNTIRTAGRENEEFRNIQFPEKIHERKDIEYEMYR